MMFTGIIKMQVYYVGNLDFLVMVIPQASIKFNNIIILLCIYIGAIAASGKYTEGLLSFGITDIHCNGTEQNISLCAQNEAQFHNCQSHDDAGVVCQGTKLLGIKT